MRRRRRAAQRPRWLRALRWALAALAAWIGVSIVLFVISSLSATGVPASAVAALDGGGLPPFSATTILVLGTDGRPAGLKEPGAAQDSESGGPVRSDTMMLIRTGGGHTSRLSIPRDTLVDMPGHGLAEDQRRLLLRRRGAARSATVESFLGIKVNHVIVINFTNFPRSSTRWAASTTPAAASYSKIDGGVRDGGYTLRAERRHPPPQRRSRRSSSRSTRENLCDPA